MNIMAKIIAGFIAGSIILCLLIGSAGMILMRSMSVRAVGQSLPLEPERVSGISATIAEYELPADFGEAYASQIAGFDLVIYNGRDGHSHVYFFQLPPGMQVNLDEIERQFDQVSGEPKIADRQTKIVDQIPVTIRGQQTTLIVSEGINSQGQAFRQVSAVFQGNGGQALVVFERPATNWDQAEIDTFLASIR